jgi:uncharacterized protein (TIGR00251 family)
MGEFSRRDGDDLVLRVRVVPRARHNEVGSVRDGFLRVRTTAPPADGKANKAVIRLLAEHLDVAPSRLSLLRGQSHKDKHILLRGPL